LTSPSPVRVASPAMRWLLAGACLVSVLSCKREAPALHASLPTPGVPAGRPATAPGAQLAMPAVDAGPPAAPLLRIMHATCGLDLGSADAGATVAGSDAGLPRNFGTRPTECLLPDGGVAWAMGVGGSRARRMATFMARLMEAEARHDPARVQRELASMDQESAHSDDGAWVLPGLLFRAPDRARGKLVRIEGTAQNVHEVDGETTLTIALDLLGHETVAITYPGIASDRVVNGAEVVVYGFGDGSHTAQSRHGEAVVMPNVIAAHVAQAESGDEEQARRILRRARRQGY